MIIKLKGIHRGWNDYVDTDNLRYMSLSDGGKWHIHMCSSDGKISMRTLCGTELYDMDVVNSDRSPSGIPTQTVCKRCKKSYDTILEKNKIKVPAPVQNVNQIANIGEPNKVKIAIQISSENGTEINLNGNIKVKTANEIIRQITSEILEVPNLTTDEIMEHFAPGSTYSTCLSADVVQGKPPIKVSG